MNRLFSKASLVAAVVCLGASGCQDEVAPPTDDNSALVVDAKDLSTRINGFAYDPEAYLYSLAMCGGPDCPEAPFLSSDTDLFKASILQGAQVGAFDVISGEPAAFASEPSSAGGVFDIPSVPSRDDPPYFLIASDGTLAPPAPDAAYPPVPTGNYPPAFTLRPIAAQSAACFAQQALQISDVGVLQAVANGLTLHGMPTTVNDLLDPSQHAGVAVWFLLQPGPPNLFAPAMGTTLTASEGMVLNIDWLPPGSVPELGQSDRGFFVTDDSVSPVGVVAVVLGPLTDAPPTVTFTVVDPTTDASSDRPWNFVPLDLTLAPGMVSIAPLQLMDAPDPNAPALGGGGGGGTPWLCLPNL
jgi:hypothetical protein